MKKIFALILCLMMLFALPVASFAEGEETVTEETATAEDGRDWAMLSSAILDWLYDNYDKALMTMFLLMSALYDSSRDKKLKKNMGTLNNNAITVAKDSSAFMSQALADIKNASGVVTSHDELIAALIAAYQQNTEDKQKLEKEIVEMKEYFKIFAESNIEFSNELAELLGLSNIPNYKKEEIGARHLAAVKAIAAAEKKAGTIALPAPVIEEVKANDGETEKN